MDERNVAYKTARKEEMLLNKARKVLFTATNTKRAFKNNDERLDKMTNEMERRKKNMEKMKLANPHIYSEEARKKDINKDKKKIEDIKTQKVKHLAEINQKKDEQIKAEIESADANSKKNLDNAITKSKNAKNAFKDARTNFKAVNIVFLNSKNTLENLKIELNDLKEQQKIVNNNADAAVSTLQQQIDLQ